MKILIHNYSSEISTEPFYLAQALANMGYETRIWNNEVSAFDIFDTFDPDVFITHYQIITTDIAKHGFYRPHSSTALMVSFS